MNTVTATLRGPADPDHYRVQVGRYGDRWYIDPLPAADIWPADDTTRPSITTIKKASGSDWSFVAMKRCATTDPDRIHQIANLPTVGERYDAFQSINKRGLEQAANRGTGVHLYCEALLNGTSTELIPSGEWQNYRAAVDAFFDQHQPELVAAEYVVINRTMNGVGYGGTPDAIVRIQGELWAIDWKSRGDDSAHGAYPEEADQIAAGLLADYMIVEGPTGPERRPVPTVAGGLIVSIKTDGCRAYPVDPFSTLWRDRHAWWCARRREREAIGRPWAPKKVQAPVTRPTDQDRRNNLSERCAAVAAISADTARGLAAAIHEIGATVTTATPDQLDRIELVVQYAERHSHAPFNDLPTGNEGGILAHDDPALTAAQAAFLALPADGQAAVMAVIDRAATLSLRVSRTARRAAILHALAVLELDGMLTDRDNATQLVRALVGWAGGPAAAATAPLVAAVEMCDHRTALRLLDGARALHENRMHLVFTDDNKIALRLVEDEPATQQPSKETQQ